MSSPQQSSTQSPRVLVVDDEFVIRELLEEFLGAGGYQVSAVASAEEGLKLVESDSFDIAVIDYGLPGMTGLELCVEIDARKLSTRLVLMTGWGTLEQAEREPSIDRVLAKPFDLSVILKTLAELAPTP